MSKSRFEERTSNAKYTAGREFERSSKKFMRRLVPVGRTLEILDIGCGTGLNAKALSDLGHAVTGVDISAVAIERFLEIGCRGIVCDVEESLPFPDRRFDLVYASETIEHLADTEVFLAEVFRVLKGGGRLLLSTPNSAFWAYRLLALLGWTLSEVQHPGHVRFFSRRSLRRHLMAAGFTHVTTAARHMYMIIGGARSRILSLLGFEQELRFKTGAYFWHLSRFAPRASGFWADTLIVTAERPNSED